MAMDTTNMADIVTVNHTDNTEFTIITFGYYMPVVISITATINVIMVIVLLKKEMRTPSNLFMLGIAVADIFTCLFPLPVWIYIYGLGHHTDYIRFSMCKFIDYCEIILPTIMHTVVVWLTVGVLLQRYISVRWSKKSGRWVNTKFKFWCGICGSVLQIIIVYVLAITFHIFRFYEFSYEPVDVQSKLDETETIEACRKGNNSTKQNSFIQDYSNSYPFVYMTFAQFIPYILLVVLSIYLMRSYGFCKTPKRQDMMQVIVVNHTTNKVVCVVVVFLVSKLPGTILMVVLIVDSHFGLGVYSDPVIIRMTYTAFLILTSPLNFVVYCSLSRSFKKNLRLLFCKC